MNGRQRLLSHSARLQKTGKEGALAQLQDAPLDRASPRLPVPIEVAVPLGTAHRALLALGRACSGADLQFHQPFYRKADHLPQQIGVSGLLDEVPQVHHVVCPLDRLEVLQGLDLYLSPDIFSGIPPHRDPSAISSSNGFRMPTCSATPRWA